MLEAKTASLGRLDGNAAARQRGRRLSWQTSRPREAELEEGEEVEVEPPGEIRACDVSDLPRAWHQEIMVSRFHAGTLGQHAKNLYLIVTTCASLI